MQIEPFQGGTKRARTKLNALVAGHNAGNDVVQRAAGLKRQLPPVPIFFGEIVEDYVSGVGTFQGTFYDYNGIMVESDSPFYALDINCQTAEANNAITGNIFVAYMSNIDAQFYCIGVFNKFGSSQSSAESSSSSSAAEDFGPIVWAALQEALQTDGKVKVVPLDAAGAQIDMPGFDVWAFASHTTSVTVADWKWSTHEVPADDDKVLIAEDQYGEWVIISPTLIKSESC